MQFLTHKKIKTFTQDLIVKAPEMIERKKDELVRVMHQDMRDAGYLPALDIGVNHTSKMDYDSGWFQVTVSVYGVFVGKDKAWRLEGIEVSNSGKVYPLASRTTKSNS